MFNLFVSSSTLNTVAHELVHALETTCTPGKSVPEKQVAVALEELYLNTAHIIKEHRLGVLGRARLTMAVQKELQMRSYSPELVSRITSALMVNAMVHARKKQSSR